MSMNGVDIASYQSPLNLATVAGDFAIIKATEGTSYVNPFCDYHFQQAKVLSRKRGVYHFASHGDAIAEADYFVDNILGYIRDAILVLDWEGSFVADVAWAHAWLNRVRDRTGVKPLIYMSEWVENAYDWSAVVNDDYGLWLAKYSNYERDNNYDMSGAGTEPVNKHWPFYILWQWTSVGRLNGYDGNLDFDIFYGDGATWDAYAGVQNAPAPAPVDPTPVPQPEPTPAPIDQPAPGEVITPTPTVPVETPEPAKEPQPSTSPQKASVKAWLELLRVLVFSLPGLLIGLLTNDPTLGFGYGTTILAVLKALDKYIHENPNTNLRGLLPF